jgi:L-threonylcarbamoyladenylate synthase
MSNVVPASRQAWAAAANIVGAGGVVAFPTDTVYGVGCNAYNSAAILRIYELKGRSFQKALPLLLSGANQVLSVARGQPQAALTLGAHFWPGALTLVLPKKEQLPDELGPGDTIAVRVPDHLDVQRFISLCGGLIAATSANISGDPDATTAEQVRAYFGDEVDLIVDGGPVRGGVPSTVVNCTVSPPSVLRQGAIPGQEIMAALSKLEAGPAAD